MENRHRTAIRKGLPRTCRDLDLSAIAPDLWGGGIYRCNDKLEAFMQITQKNMQNMTFLNDIQTRGPKAFRILMESLRTSDQGHVADIMDPQKEFPAPPDPPVSHHPMHASNAQAANTRGAQSSGPSVIAQPNTQPDAQQVSQPSDSQNQPSDLSGSDQSDTQNRGTQYATTSPDECYKMEANPRGVALIINNESFSVEKLKQRKGTDKDCEKMDKLFSEFGFHVVKKTNLTVEEMKNFFELYSEKDHGEYDCFVSVIMSHGIEMGIYGKDGETVEVNYLVEIMDKCKSLNSKPKLFFAQACRGESCAVVELDARCASIDESVNTELEASMDALKVSGVRDSRSHAQKDIVIGFPSVEGHASVREPIYGSWYIQSLDKVFREYAKSVHLVDMLTKVNREMQGKKGELKSGKVITQTSQYKSTLVKSLFFNPPPPQMANVEY